MSDLRQSIFRTVAYFDIFDYPLTALEVWRFLHDPGSEKRNFEDIFSELEKMAQEVKLDTEKGFYFLTGRRAILDIRSKRYTFSFSKYRQARRFAKILSFVPGVRLVAIGNTLAWRNSREDSDIDFFIVAAPGRLWSVRFFSVMLAAMLGTRPRKGKESSDALCLSFFASEDALDLRGLMIKDDIYFPYWVASIVPIFESKGVFEKFKEANNWVYALLPNVFFRTSLPSSASINISSKIVPDFAERLFKRIQIRMFPEDISQKTGYGKSEVVVSDSYLKFHTNDKRAFIRDEWRKKIVQHQII